MVMMRKYKVIIEVPIRYNNLYIKEIISDSLGYIGGTVITIDSDGEYNKEEEE